MIANILYSVFAIMLFVAPLACVVGVSMCLALGSRLRDHSGPGDAWTKKEANIAAYVTVIGFWVSVAGWLIFLAVALIQGT